MITKSYNKTLYYIRISNVDYSCLNLFSEYMKFIIFLGEVAIIIKYGNTFLHFTCGFVCILYMCVFACESSDKFSFCDY